MSKKELDAFFGAEYNLTDLQNQIVQDLGADGMVTEELIRYVVLAAMYRTMQTVAKYGRVEYRKLFSIELRDIKARKYKIKGQEVPKGVRKKAVLKTSAKFRALIEQETGVEAV